MGAVRFRGTDAPAFVAAAFDGDELSDPVTAEPEAEPATCGRVPVDGDDLPDELARSPDGERTCRASASRSTGRSRGADGLDTEPSDGDASLRSIASSSACNHTARTDRRTHTDYCDELPVSAGDGVGNDR